MLTRGQAERRQVIISDGLCLICARVSGIQRIDSQFRKPYNARNTAFAKEWDCNHKQRRKSLGDAKRREAKAGAASGLMEQALTNLSKGGAKKVGALENMFEFRERHCCNAPTPLFKLALRAQLLSEEWTGMLETVRGLRLSIDQDRRRYVALKHPSAVLRKRRLDALDHASGALMSDHPKCSSCFLLTGGIHVGGELSTNKRCALCNEERQGRRTMYLAERSS